MLSPKVFRVLVFLGWVVIVLGAFIGTIVVLGALGDEEVGGRVGIGLVVLAQAVISGTLLIALGRMGQLLADATESLRVMNHRVGELVDVGVTRRR